MATNGYTYQEMQDFGFYEWTEVAREAYASEYGCDYYEDCPCCKCDEAIVSVITYARPRWSRSGKRMVEDTMTVSSCVAHA